MRKILLRQNYPNRVVTISDVYSTIENMQHFDNGSQKRALGRVAKVWSYLEIDGEKLSERMLAKKELETSDKEIDRKVS